ncbi:uncharacterized protein [Phyllobates terribilis]|uniref:uncharacterized protein n=1 Tax=Phyllobates terribilis TaxID=111132 RepID=UPI003CCB2DEC
MEFVRNMERRRLIKPQDILATLQSIPEDESESELQEHVFDSDSDEDFIPQNISSESEDSEGTNPEDIPSTSTGDRAHAVMLPRDHPPGRGQKKSAKRPRNERTTDSDGGEGNATTNTREGESEGILVSADGIQWKPVEIGEHLPGRRDSQNILREAPGPTGYARRNIIIDNPLSAWRLFFDSYILTHIKNCTLAEACRNNNLQFTLSDEELDAFIAIFYARGISGTNRHSISSIWCNDWGIPFCKATMSRDRFVEIMRFLRFDEKSTRSERLQTDKFALFSTVWDRFIENCIACYKPGPYITVDEQLFPSKTRCPFTQYMPSKPDKYGHKYWLAVDKRSKYLDRLADHVVMKLLDPFLKKECIGSAFSFFSKDILFLLFFGKHFISCWQGGRSRAAGSRVEEEVELGCQGLCTNPLQNPAVMHEGIVQGLQQNLSQNQNRFFLLHVTIPKGSPKIRLRCTTKNCRIQRLVKEILWEKPTLCVMPRAGPQGRHLTQGLKKKNHKRESPCHASPPQDLH